MQTAKECRGFIEKREHPGVGGFQEKHKLERTADFRGNRRSGGKRSPYRNTASPQTVKKRKFWLAVSVLCNASLLIFFKLSNVFEENMLLPVGIAFLYV